MLWKQLSLFRFNSDAGFTLHSAFFENCRSSVFHKPMQKKKNFRNISKNIFALPVLPEHEMVASFHFYKTTIADIFQKYPQLSSFFDYVYDFLSKVNISMEMFCVFDWPPTHQTTNNCKGWNSKWNADFQHENPSFLDDFIKTCQSRVQSSA